MANKLTFLQLPIPPQTKRSKLIKKTWTDFNRRHTVDSGSLSYEKNISTAKYPFITPSERPLTIKIDNKPLIDGEPLSVHGFDDFIVVVSANKNDNKVYFTKIYKTESGYGKTVEIIDTEDTTSQRSIVQFNVFNDEQGTVLNGKYERKLIVFPDKVYIPYDGDFKASSIETEGNAVPSLKYATVHLSRVFGVDDGRVYASGFNDYTNWNVDTADEYNESNAWFSASQSNTKADGTFTGITTFQNHVVCFKKDYMHEIYNTKNPFRIQDIYAEGAIDNRTIQDVDGQLIFCSEDNVKVYTGGNPRIISYNLGVDVFDEAVSGTDGRCYYLYCETKEEKHLFVYDTYCGAWSERSSDKKIIGFAKCSFGFFAVDEDANLMKLDTGSYSHEWMFDTDLMTTGTCDIKRVDKMQIAFDVKRDIDDELSVWIYNENDSENNPRRIWQYDGELSGYVVGRAKIRGFVCNAFKLRVKGKGNICIRSLELFIKQGGELYE